ncbi:hypothetical protein BC941DRAFT_519172 [Chlamydoabsidia padenii]|nr:hypothetical protein BC941DRAFT_519172 [Chlamydoabsidia padenii]
MIATRTNQPREAPHTQPTSKEQFIQLQRILHPLTSIQLAKALEAAKKRRTHIDSISSTGSVTYETMTPATAQHFESSDPQQETFHQTALIQQQHQPQQQAALQQQETLHIAPYEHHTDMPQFADDVLAHLDSLHQEQDRQHQTQLQFANILNELQALEVNKRKSRNYAPPSPNQPRLHQVYKTRFILRKECGGIPVNRPPSDFDIRDMASLKYQVYLKHSGNAFSFILYVYNS